ncbi:MAG: UvrD-helicase domain-containing protein [Euryarchaeota archaeon]|nr:UvrD-helicase domain-containing protein [Euryarchaeota archaeon]
MSLDAEQIQAIQNLDGPMLILASAGTGKTRTPMAKVAALLDNSVPTNEIMLVTFTNKAANEMKTRLIAMGHDIHNMWIGTFHNICNRILRENYSKISGLNSRYTIIMPDECHKLAKLIIKGIELEETMQELNDMSIYEFLHEVQLKSKSKASIPADHITDRHPLKQGCNAVYFIS